jgi:hypothetical protein
MPEFNPSDLIGRTFLQPLDKQGNRSRARVADVVYEYDTTDQLAQKINIMLEVGEEKDKK